MNEEKLERIAELIRQLNPTRLAGWGASRMPNEIDDEITQVLKGYLELDDGEKRKVRESVERGQKFVFLAFAERMASLAIRLKSPEPLLMGTMAMFYK